MKAFLQLSASKRAESLVALKVRNTPIGKSMMDDSHTPKNMLRLPDTAMRSAVIEVTQ